MLLVVGVVVWIAVASTGSASAVSLVKIDGTDATIVGTVDDGLITDHLWRALTVENGALFQMTPSAVRSRDLASGEVLQSFPTSEDHDASAIGFGSEWLGSKTDTRSLQRVDLVSGTVVDSIDVQGGAGVLAVGPDAVWFVTTDGGPPRRPDLDGRADVALGRDLAGRGRPVP